jgi:hypothetical protein
VTSEMDWTRKYKRALLERDPAQRMCRIHEAKDAMEARRTAIDSASQEGRVIDRAMDILASLGKSFVASNPKAGRDISPT